MKKLFFFSVALAAITVACAQPSQSKTTVAGETQQEEEASTVTSANRAIDFKLLGHQFAYDIKGEDNLEVDVIGTQSNSWIFHFNASNASSSTKSTIQLTVNDFDVTKPLEGSPTVTKGSLTLYSESENPPFPMASNYLRGTPQFKIQKVEFVKSSGAMGLNLDYYLVSGSFSATFTDIMGENELVVENGTFSNLVLMHTR